MVDSDNNNTGNTSVLPDVSFRIPTPAMGNTFNYFVVEDIIKTDIFQRIPLTSIHSPDDGEWRALGIIFIRGFGEPRA